MASRKETPSRRGSYATKGGNMRPKAIHGEVIPTRPRAKGTVSTGLIATSDRVVRTGVRPPRTHKMIPTAFGASLDEVRTGLPYNALEQLRADAALTQAQLAELLGIPERTIARRKVDGRLTPAESDRVDRTARILKLCADVLEGADKAQRWLQKPNRGLGGLTPLSLLDTDRGTRAVEDALMAIEHGMYG